MSTTTELKPCPFCGSEPEVTTWGADTRTGAPFHQIECCECGCSIGHSSDPLATHVENWNRRSAAYGESKAGEWTDERIEAAFERDCLRGMSAPSTWDETTTQCMRFARKFYTQGVKAVISSAPAQAGSAESEREAFEKWWASSGFEKFKETAWASWQARAALSAQGGQQSEDAKRLAFVLENGLPMKRDRKYRYHGHADLGWFDSQIKAIDAAMSTPSEKEQG